MGTLLNKIFFANFLIICLSWGNLIFAAIAQDCDDYLDMEIAAPVADMVDPGSNGLPREILILRADQAGHYSLAARAEVAADYSNPPFPTPAGILVLRAGQQWDSGLASASMEDSGTGGGNSQIKNPVLFVPGLLGTEIFDNEEKIWPDILRMIADPFDSFLDKINFNDKLLPSNNLLIKSVIRKEIIFDYTQGLIDEFTQRGYKENETFFTFPYDWRYGASGYYPVPDNTSQIKKTNRDLLQEKISQIMAQTGAQKVDVIAHSLGGLIVKKHIMESADPKIGKLVFLGVPNLGSPKAAKTLLVGDDMGIFGLNPSEFKKISRNMPAAYDLLPSREYFNKKGSYMTAIRPVGLFANRVEPLDFNSVSAILPGFDLNPDGLAAASRLHASGFDNYSFDFISEAGAKGVQAYNIVACKTATLGSLEDWRDTDGNHDYFLPGPDVTGDDTVPFEIADSIPVDDSKKFYFPRVAHGKMPSAAGIRQKITSIITGFEYPQYEGMVTRRQLLADHSLCELFGDQIIVKSPVDIYVADDSGNVVLGPDRDGNVHYDIPGASFRIMEGHKYLYLPSEARNAYHIGLKGTDYGAFTLVHRQIEGGQAGPAQVFNDIPVTTDFSGKLELSAAGPQIIAANRIIEPAAPIDVIAANDILAPQTEITINGTTTMPIYNQDVTINLRAFDLAQDLATPSGVLGISYRFDGEVTTTVAAAQVEIPVSQEGSHRLVFQSVDRLGNRQNFQVIEFAIDKTPPVINCPAPPVFILNQSGAELTVGIIQDPDGESKAKTFSLPTSQPGHNIQTVEACDSAANCTRKDCAYQVKYDFKGFFAPVNNPVMVNTGKAGRNFPVKWRLQDASGAPQSALNCVVSVNYQAIDCLSAALAPVNPLYETAAPSGLRYDPDAGQFVYNWKTQAVFAGKCYRLAVNLADGTSRVALFSFAR